MAHICHGKTYFSTAKLTFPRQNLLFHAKTYFFTPKLTIPRQNLLFHGKTYFFTAKLTIPRQNLLFHGKTYFSTAKLTFPRQNLLFHGKTYFSTAKLTFPRQNLLFHGKTYYFLCSYFRLLVCLCQQFPAILTALAPTWRTVRRKKTLCKYNENLAVCDFQWSGFRKFSFYFHLSDFMIRFGGKSRRICCVFEGIAGI